MTDISSLATKIEAAQIAGNGITLDATELDGLLRIAALLGRDVAPPASAPVGDPDECLTIEEVCTLLKIDRRTLYRWRVGGKFQPTPVIATGTPRWLRQDVVRWLQEHQA